MILVKQLESAMNDEEKQKLYRAIDYHESVTPASYPASFVAIRLEFVLRALKIVVIDDHQLGNQQLTNSTMDDVSNYVMTVKFKEVMASITQRPAVQSYAYVISDLCSIIRYVSFYYFVIFQHISYYAVFPNVGIITKRNCTENNSV